MLDLMHPTQPHLIGPRVASNAAGAVVGTRVVGEGSSQTTEAFIWLPRAMYGLSAGLHSLHPQGAEGSVAPGINDVGTVVGGVLHFAGALVALSNSSPCV